MNQKKAKKLRRQVYKGADQKELREYHVTNEKKFVLSPLKPQGPENEVIHQTVESIGRRRFYQLSKKAQ